MSTTDTRQAAVHDALADNWFCALATTSAEGRPHVAGVLYALVDRDLYVNTDRTEHRTEHLDEIERLLPPA